jgi:hypothetical protein
VGFEVFYEVVEKDGFGLASVELAEAFPGFGLGLSDEFENVVGEKGAIAIVGFAIAFVVAVFEKGAIDRLLEIRFGVHGGGFCVRQGVSPGGLASKC